METCNELLLQAISTNDLNTVRYCLRNGANVNKICSGGTTPLGAAAQTGNLQMLKILAESTKNINNLQLDVDNDNQEDLSRPLYLKLDTQPEPVRGRKNIGYFVVCKDMDDNDLGDGPTPDGMDALEWDMEITDEGNNDLAPSPEINIYKWYAKILNQTSILLKSPDYDVTRLDTHGQTVLHYAVRFGSKEMVDFLLMTFTEINVNQSDSSWNIPLHISCIRGDIDLVQLLIKKGANINAANTNRETPLHYAAQHGHLHVVQLLIDKGANLNNFDMEDRSPLSLAIDNIHEDVAEVLIHKGTRLNHEECLGYTVLYKAVWNNLLRTSRNLLKSGSKIVHSHFLLHIATRHNNLEMVKLLCENGAVVNIRDEHGNTPLMSACINKNFDIARYFLQNGAPVNTVNQINGMTALHLCVQGVQDPKQFEMFLQLLLSYDVDLNANSYQGNVLFYSIILGNLEAARLLVKYGVDVNRRDEHAYFDNLSLAKKQGDLHLVRLIVYAGFDFCNLLFNLKTLQTSGDDGIYEFLVNVKTSPLDLRELCRIRIRRLLRRQIIAKIYQLPLPSMILHYLALDIL
ncbi:putative ankyrin repeat protein RF_0381 [Atheta coriaria]|uniref:putative ankyrin repeat protein RF_0381 n=1 Tax=Dalotia coriaria TaxID=877792 RepID=UPI0031F42283